MLANDDLTAFARCIALMRIQPVLNQHYGARDQKIDCQVDRAGDQKHFDRLISGGDDLLGIGRDLRIVIVDASDVALMSRIISLEKCALAGAGTAQREITSPSWASSDKPFKTSKDPKDL